MKKTVCKGPNYKYLGHFSQQKWLDKGHNDVGASDSGGIKPPSPVAIAPVQTRPPAPQLPEYDIQSVDGGGIRGRSMVRDPRTIQPPPEWKDPTWVSNAQRLNDAGRPQIGPRRRA